MANMPSAVSVFDYNLIRARLQKTRKAYGAVCARDFDFLLRLAATRLDERLDEIRKPIERIVDIGGAFAPYSVRGNGMDVCDGLYQENDAMDIPRGIYDAAVANFMLGFVDDLPGVLAQIRHALKPDGVFLAVLPGGETLRELRAALMEAEIETRGGASLRVAPFVDRYDMAALMQRAGFALPVVDSDIVTVSYDTIFHLMRDLRGMGAANPLQARARGVARRDMFMRAGDIYMRNHAEDGRIQARFELVFAIGWAPDASQPQPLPRGSGAVHMGDAIGRKTRKD